MAHVLVRVAYTVQSPSTDATQSRIAKVQLPLQTAPAAHASVHLKPCLRAICASQPELLETDFSVACLDLQETEMQQQHRQAALSQGLNVSPVKKGQSSKVWEGKGMLSWVLQEPNREGESLATGKLDAATNTLHVSLQLSERKALSKSKASFFDALNTQPVASTSSLQEPHFLMNVIQPTPYRDVANAVPTLGQSSSSPCTTKPALGYSPSLGANPPSPLPDRDSIITLIHTLLPQLQVAMAEDNGKAKAAFAPLIQTITAYLASTPMDVDSAPTTPRQQADRVQLDAFETLLKSMTSTTVPAHTAQPQVPVPAPVAALKTSQKRKHPDEPADIPIKKRAVAAPTTASTAAPASEPSKAAPKKRGRPVGSDANVKQKYDKEGCSNCHTHLSTVWRKRKNAQMGPDGKPIVHRLCNACGVHFNRYGSHRVLNPVEVSREEEDLLAAVRRSPRRHKTAQSKPSPVRSKSLTDEDVLLTQLLSDFSHPSDTFRRPSSGHDGVDSLAASDASRSTRAGSTYSTASSSHFDTASLLDDRQLSDVFGALTSDMDPPASEHQSAAFASLGGLLADWGLPSYLSDADLKASSGSHRLASDAFSDLDLASMPPSSPPRGPPNPFAHLAPSETGDSPNWPEPSTVAEPSKSRPVASLAPSDVTWSTEAIAMLTQALGPTGNLEESTLQDLFANLPGLSGSSPLVESPPGSQGLGLNLEGVAEVNASVALDIWNKEIVPGLSSALPQA